MLDQIIDLIRNNAGGAVVNNPAVPNEKNESAIRQGGNSIVETLKNALAGGRINDVLGYFKNGASGNHPIIDEATNNYSRDLQTNVGLNEKDAGDVASKVIPASMTQLANKTADPNDNKFDIQDIFNQLSGGKTGGLNISGLLNRFGGGKLDKDRDGDVDLQDLKSMFAGDGASGFLDTAKGFFNK
ncbi:MAG TPA: hypothetical protein VM101_00070 [Flavitalea sp.]|nr:hypothetical protein [Flavitalea sp.]